MNIDSGIEIPAFDAETGTWNLIIETPQGSHNKYKYDPKRRLFQLSGVLGAGLVFPFDFGFVPSTLGEDGDPLDVLVLMSEPAFCGCLVPGRLLGVIEAEQTEEGKTMRNDRLIAVAAKYPLMSDVQTLSDLNAHLLDQIEHFFISYNQIRGKEFRPLGRQGSGRAEPLVHDGEKRYRQSAKA